MDRLVTNVMNKKKKDESASNSDSDSSSGSSSSSSDSSEERKRIELERMKKVEPLPARKFNLRQQLDIFQVDEEVFEDDQ